MFNNLTPVWYCNFSTFPPCVTANILFFRELPSANLAVSDCLGKMKLPNEPQDEADTDMSQTRKLASAQNVVDLILTNVKSQLLLRFLFGFYWIGLLSNLVRCLSQVCLSPQFLFLVLGVFLFFFSLYKLLNLPQPHKETSWDFHSSCINQNTISCYIYSPSVFHDRVLYGGDRWSLILF